MAEIAVANPVEKKKWPPIEEVTLEFPLRECENCGWSLLDAPAKATEKGFNSDRKMVYTDFCPRCGRGYVVWTESVQAVPTPAPVPETGAPKRVYDVPDNLAPPERPAPFKGAYYCPKCNKNHMEKSKLGKTHLKHKEGN
ncbi:hypothetical protein LCGC14_1649520 [marine sediment metagenome]|uniref:Uncharacterized protein n=1 Tax=marine sediment metagenome TaxID=412755 RepID=A0A0F9IJT9_9ZZZZ